MSVQYGKTILSFDEARQFTYAIRNCLTPCGHTVICATSLDEGLDLFAQRQHEIDLVIVEIVSPMNNSLDFAAELERRRPGIPILYLVGPLMSIARCCIEAEAPSAVLPVPFSGRSLLESVVALSQIAPATVPMQPENGENTESRIPPSADY